MCRMIEVSAARVRYRDGEPAALDGIDLRIERGSVVGARGLQRIGQVHARAAAVRHAPRGRGALHRRRHRPRLERRRPAGGPPGGRPGPPASQRPDRLHRRGRRGRLRSPQPRSRTGRGRAPRGGRPRRGGARRLHRPRHGGALRRRAAAARARRRPGDGALLPRARRGVVHARPRGATGCCAYAATCTRTA